MHKINIKTILINFLILVLIFLAPGIIWKLNWFKVRSSRAAGDKRAEFNVTKNKNITEKVLKEYKQLPYTYKSFIGWRRDNANLEHTKISGKYNTRFSLGESLNNSTWFFGGSTVWGVGVTNNQTIPSHFHNISGEKVINFGESGWGTRQDLNLLMNVLGDQKKPKRIVFYSGMNDTFGQCASHINNIPSNSKEKSIGKRLKSTPESLFLEKSLNFVFRPYTDMLKRLNPPTDLITDAMYDCDSNTLKANSISNHLIKNWEMAYNLSVKNGAEFIAILHPHAFTYKGEVSYLGKTLLHPEKRKQLDVIYSKILKYKKNGCKNNFDFCKSIYDGTNWLSKNTRKKIYIDNAHLNSDGNKFIAEEIYNISKNN